MRFAILTILIASPAFAQDRFVERTPMPRKPVEYTMPRAGNPRSIAPWAVPSVTRYEAGGYIGGGSVKGNSILAKGPASATGPIGEGVYGTDFAGFRMRMGRVFLAPSANPAAGPSIARNYRTDGPHVPDVFAIRPFRKAILEKKEDLEERKGEK